MAVELPTMMFPEPQFHKSLGETPSFVKKWEQLVNDVPSKFTWGVKPKLIGAYDVQCKTIMDTYKQCSRGFMYDPQAILDCAPEYAQMRSCLYSTKMHALQSCENSMDNILEANRTNSVNSALSETLVDCIRENVIKTDISSITLKYTNDFMSTIETDAKSRGGLFSGYIPRS